MKPLPKSPALVPLAFVVGLLGTMLCALLAAPLVAAMLEPIATVPPRRVFSRLTMLGMAVITIWLLRRYGLANREVLGFTGAWPRFLRRAAIALAAGAGVMLLAVLPLLLLEVRDWNQNLPAQWTGWLPLIAKGLGTGLAVALIEETFFRGAMQGTLQRLGGMRWALLVVPALYAAVHFIGRLAHPMILLEPFVALWCVGLLLALVRRRWGDIAGCIGLHAGFVAVITVFRKVSSPAPAGDWSFLVGSFDGLLGWWIAAVALLASLLLAVRAPGRIQR